MPLEVVSKVLGHANLKDTMIYAKVVDSAKIAYMDLWNKSDDKKDGGKAEPTKNTVQSKTPKKNLKSMAAKK
jgi:hypothetical protein